MIVALLILILVAILWPEALRTIFLIGGALVVFAILSGSHP